MPSNSTDLKGAISDLHQYKKEQDLAVIKIVDTKSWHIWQVITNDILLQGAEHPSFWLVSLKVEGLQHLWKGLIILQDQAL